MRVLITGRADFTGSHVVAAVAPAGVDAVCHQAAMVGLGLDLQDRPDHAGINDLGTAVLLAAMARADVGRLVPAGSMVVHGEGPLSCPARSSAAGPDGPLASAT